MTDSMQEMRKLMHVWQLQIIELLGVQTREERVKTVKKMNEILQEVRPNVDAELVYSKKLGTTLLWASSTRNGEHGIPLYIMHTVDRIYAKDPKTGETILIKDRWAVTRSVGSFSSVYAETDKIPESLVLDEHARARRTAEDHVMSEDAAREVLAEHDAGMTSMFNPSAKASVEEARHILRERGFLK